jgi:hypothetical protein
MHISDIHSGTDMLADYADACNRGARHVVGGSTGLSVSDLSNIHTSKLSRTICLTRCDLRAGMVAVKLDGAHSQK